MKGERADPVLILVRAAGFGWQTVREIINARPGVKLSPQTLDAAHENFDRLTSRRPSALCASGKCGPAPASNHALRNVK